MATPGTSGTRYSGHLALQVPEDGVGQPRLVRGGSWNNYARNCRSANRNRNRRDNRNNNIGFRVLCPFPSTLHRESWRMGNSLSVPEESSPTPVMLVTTSKKQPEPDSLVALSNGYPTHP